MKIASQGEMEALGVRIAGFLRPGDCVFLMGDLGAGKSVLARAIGRALGVTQPMPSPSFGLLASHTGRVRVNHFDLYRLEDYSEFLAAGLDEVLWEEDAVALVEWPEILFDERSARVEVQIERGSAENERIVSVRFVEMEGRAHADFGT